MSNNDLRYKQRAAGGVFLAALGFLTAQLASEWAPYTVLALVAALALFVTGLIMLETALFAALDASHEEAAEERASWVFKSASFQ